MNAVAASTGPDATLPPLDQAGDAEFYCDMLDEIMETAADFARAIRENLRNDRKTATPEMAVALDRVARIVRRCMLLVCKLIEGRPARILNARSRSEARARVRQQVQAAQTRAPPDSQAEAGDSNDSPDRLDALGPGTIPELIAGLCQDLNQVAAQLGHIQPEQPSPPTLTTQALPPKTPLPQNPSPPGEPQQSPIPWKSSG